MDIVFIKQLAIEMVIGVYDFEKTQLQPLLLDIEMGTDIRQAAVADDLSKTLDYAVVSEQVTALLTREPIELIETVAERVAALILNGFACKAVRVTVNKPTAVAQAQTVGVTISRGQW